MASRKELEGKIPRLAGEYVTKNGFVTAVDLLMALGWLNKKDYEDWRFGRIPYLEKVVGKSLAGITFAMKCFRSWAIKSHLKPSYTSYKKWGKGLRIDLRFSKSGADAVERAYSTHYVLQRKERQNPSPNLNTETQDSTNAE